MVFTIILLILGFLLLIKGADWFVDGASAVARKLRIPSMIIGLTVVACGTSLPELIVSLLSSIQGSNEMAISNVTGSNIFNLFMLVGVCAIIHQLKMDKLSLRRDLPVAIISMVIIAFLACDQYIFGKESIILSRIDGIILFVLFILYMLLLLRQAKKERKGHLDDAFDEELITASGVGENLKVLFGSKKKYSDISPSFAWSIVILILGGACIAGGGELVVHAASEIARASGMSETFIGLTIAAVGTSLPEFVTSVAAVVKGEYDLAIGNCVGSNIFNALFVLGIAATVSPVGVLPNNIIDIGILTAASILVLVFASVFKKVNRGMGVVMVAFYVAFFFFVLNRA